MKYRVIFNQKSTYLVTNNVLTEDQLTKTLNVKDPVAQSQIDDLTNKFRSLLNRLNQSDLLLLSKAILYSPVHPLLIKHYQSS